MLFQDLWWFLIFFAASYLLLVLIYQTNSGPIKKIFMVLGMLGIVVHELSHWVMCKICRVKTDGIRIKYRDQFTGEVRPHGSVGLKDFERSSFAQEIMVGFAPLMVGTWSTLLLLDLAFTSSIPLVQVLSFLAAVSIFLMSSPSQADLYLIRVSFSKDPPYSLYQVSLMVISMVIAHVVFTQYVVLEAMEAFPFLVYFFVGLFYVTLKYSIKGINHVIHALLRHRGVAHEVSDFRRYRRRSLRPRVPWKTKNGDDGEW